LIRRGEFRGGELCGTWWPYPNSSLPSCMSYCYDMRKVSQASDWEFYPGLLAEEDVIRAETFDLNRRKTRKPRVPNWPRFDLRKPWIQLLFLFVAFLYGGLHSLAWNALFPSSTERLLWQISSSIIMGAGVPALICYFLSETTYGHDIGPNNPHYAFRWRMYTFRLSKPILNYRLYCILGRPREALLNRIRG
jgi:hypothetical protein